MGIFVALIVVLACLVLWLVVTSITRCSSPTPVDEQPATTTPATEREEPSCPTSTPRSDWEKGTVPELFQTDPAWADESYAGGTMAKNGCGVTCMAMVYIALTGDTAMGPVEMAAFSEEGGYVEGGGTPWRFMSDGGAELGLTVETLPNVAKYLIDELNEGHPIIVNVGPGTFTTVGHYIVLTKADGNDRVFIHNPNAPEDNETSWDINLIMDEARNFWAFSA